MLIQKVSLLVIPVLLVGLGILKVRRKKRWRRNAKDYAFHVFYSFGPGFVSTEHLIRKVDWIDKETLHEWADDFSGVSKLLGRLAEEGGTSELGHAIVIQRIQNKYPFLQDEGRHTAIFLVDYMKMKG